MKATDLMIGDWVIRKGVPEEPMRVFDMKVSAGIAYLVQDGRGVAEKFENIEPIPLTPEILEKNGWVLDDIDESYRNYDNHFWIGGVNAPFGVMVSNLYQDINYVHELQHLLKLCKKIEKEIVLSTTHH